MSNENVKKILGNAFMDIATAIETGNFGSKAKVGLTTFGSEHGQENLIRGAEMAARRLSDVEIVLIGAPCETTLRVVEAADETDAHKKMEALLDSGELDSCVTMHYSFPIGVSTVGRVQTPAMGKEMIIATTTGTSATNRTEAMIKNAIYGIVAAKSIGIEEPTVGILNVDNARTVERALKELDKKGFPIKFGESGRADGGSVMRGNDLLMGSCDVMVTDTLSGNILMKMFSSFNTGGSYEATGYGYGPGIGFDYDRTVLILSRASGAPVVANAIQYAADLAKGDVKAVSKHELDLVKAVGLEDVINDLVRESHDKVCTEEVVAPPKEVVTGTISGIDIMDLDDACQVLWAKGIYAESGMGCTGPIVMVNEAKLEAAIEELADKGYVSKEATPC